MRKNYIMSEIYPVFFLNKAASWMTLAFFIFTSALSSQNFTVVDTGQDACYDDLGAEIVCPTQGSNFHGQDAQYLGPQPSYLDHGNGTVTDETTGLMWQKTPGAKATWAEAVAAAPSTTIGGHTDWRLPTIKELYSLIDFSGSTGTSAATSVPYIDTAYFNFEYGDEAVERFIDAQYVSATDYVWTTMNGDDTVFGVNFADGRIKGYGKSMPDGTEKTFFVRHVRLGEGDFENDFSDGGDGTITDIATSLMWLESDSGSGMNWEAALAWADGKNAENYLGYDDWRLPNAKELQSLVDYTRAPDATGTPAIDPLFSVSVLPDGEIPYFWASTTHLDGPPETQGDYAVYVTFGRAQGFMEIPPDSGNYQLLDVHGAGAQRSDPKDGDPADYPQGHGPQGDVIRIFNYVRLVRDTGDPAVQLIFSDNFESGDTTSWSGAQL